MLRQEQNDMICQTGPGDADGRLVPTLLDPRAAWPRNCQPTIARRCASSSCPSAWLRSATAQGRYGLIDEFCPHRGVSLWFGRNEECGLRCPYHGWKFDFTGQCIEVPSEPEESGFAKKIKLKSYPLVERGGILWTYMGPAGAHAAAAGVGIRHGRRPSSASYPSASRNPIGCRRWKAASIRATSPGCTATTSTRTRCSRAPPATSTTWPT